MGEEQTETKIVVLLGPPGGGKGTQAKKLVAEFGWLHVSTGDVLRQEVRDESELGKRAKAIMESGELVPDDLVGQIIRKRLDQNDSVPGFLLDGFPRTVAQAEFLDQVSGGKPVFAIGIEVEEGQVVKRLSGRRFCQKCGNIYNIYFSPPTEPGICECGAELVRRKDDWEDVIKERLRVYHEQTRPVIDFYRSVGSYFPVDGNWEPNDVYFELRKVARSLSA